MGIEHDKKFGQTGRESWRTAAGSTGAIFGAIAFVMLGTIGLVQVVGILRYAVFATTRAGIGAYVSEALARSWQALAGAIIALVTVALCLRLQSVLSRDAAWIVLVADSCAFAFAVLTGTLLGTVLAVMIVIHGITTVLAIREPD